MKGETPRVMSDWNKEKGVKNPFFCAHYIRQAPCVYTLNIAPNFDGVQSKIFIYCIICCWVWKEKRNQNVCVSWMFIQVINHKGNWLVQFEINWLHEFNFFLTRGGKFSEGFLDQFRKMSSQFNFQAFELKLFCLSGFYCVSVNFVLRHSNS